MKAKRRSKPQKPKKACRFSNILQFGAILIALSVCYYTYMTLDNIRTARINVVSERLNKENFKAPLDNVKSDFSKEEILDQLASKKKRSKHHKKEKKKTSGNQKGKDQKHGNHKEEEEKTSTSQKVDEIEQPGFQDSNIQTLPSKPQSSKDIHVVFSTDCGGYQNWQADVFFHSATLVGHTSPITRIASGCSQEEQQRIQTHHENYLSSQFRVHFTPDFSWDEKRNKRYPYYNKPHGILHWLENVVSEETIVALCDPDMIFLRPLSPFLNHSELLLSGGVKAEEIGAMVAEGQPVGQTYGFGGAWTRMDTVTICGEGSPCTTVKDREAAKYYAVGPPYIAHKRDWMKMAKSWVEFVPKSFDQLPSLMAEMYAFCMAAAHHNLKHWKLDNYMVSNVRTPGEGWKFVKPVSNVCHEIGTEYPLPTFLHYCQRYWASDFIFAKRRFPHDFFSCEHPYFLEPPEDLQTVLYAMKPEGDKIPLTPEEAKQNAFMICSATRTVNSALKNYKEKACDPNTQKNDVVQFSFANFK